MRAVFSYNDSFTLLDKKKLYVLSKSNKTRTSPETKRKCTAKISEHETPCGSNNLPGGVFPLIPVSLPKVQKYRSAYSERDTVELVGDIWTQQMHNVEVSRGKKN